MGGLDILSLFSGQPELYAILALLCWMAKKTFPLLKQRMIMEQSKLEGNVRREDILKEILEALNTVNSNIKTLATKDDVIDILLHKPKNKVLNGSGSITKQGID